MLCMCSGATTWWATASSAQAATAPHAAALCRQCAAYRRTTPLHGILLRGQRIKLIHNVILPSSARLSSGNFSSNSSLKITFQNWNVMLFEGFAKIRGNSKKFWTTPAWISSISWPIRSSSTAAKVSNRQHGSYKWIIMLEKCGHPDIDVYHIKWIIGNHGNWKKQNPGGRFGATS